MDIKVGEWNLNFDEAVIVGNFMQEYRSRKVESKTDIHTMQEILEFVNSFPCAEAETAAHKVDNGYFTLLFERDISRVSVYVSLDYLAALMGK